MNMLISQARDYVYAFGDLLAAETPLIGDALQRPCPKDTLKKAFGVYLLWMRDEREMNPASFERDGYDDTLRTVESCCARIDDFHDIAPEDKQAVECAKRNPSSFISGEDIALLGKCPLGGVQ